MTKAGLARARAQGKQLGHPRVDIARAYVLRVQGMSYREIAKALGVSHQTVKNRLRNEGVPSPKGNETSSGGIRNGR